MTPEIAVDIARQALIIIIKVSSPMLIVSMIVGLIISIFQTVTSIQEQTLTFAPKLIAIFLVLMFSGVWILKNVVDFFTWLVSNFPVWVK